MEVKEFNDLIKEGNVLVDFYANWCGPCKMLASELDSIKEEVKIIKVNVDDDREIAKIYGVMSIPTLIYFKSEEEYDKRIGFINKDEILKWIKEGL